LISARKDAAAEAKDSLSSEKANYHGGHGRKMRPLLHPSVEEITLEGILHALSDPDRAGIYAEIAGSACPQTCSQFLMRGGREIPKSTLSQHFRILREAGLIRAERHGVEVRNSTRCEEVENRFPGLLPAILQAYAANSPKSGRGKTNRSPRRG
jgi:DNA-binding transcriptional ArsR family regulator